MADHNRAKSTETLSRTFLNYCIDIITEMKMVNLKI